MKQAYKPPTKLRFVAICCLGVLLAFLSVVLLRELSRRFYSSAKSKETITKQADKPDNKSRNNGKTGKTQNTRR